MADAQKYTAGETLCRVLNAGEDALKVDIDNVTLTRGERYCYRSTLR